MQYKFCNNILCNNVACIYPQNVLSMVSLRITYFLSSGKVGGLTDLTSAAAANGLLVGISQDHLESSKSVSRLYGTQHMTSVASAYPENIQGMGLNVLIFMHFNSKIIMIK